MTVFSVNRAWLEHGGTHLFVLSHGSVSLALGSACRMAWRLGGWVRHSPTQSAGKGQMAAAGREQEGTGVQVWAWPERGVNRQASPGEGGCCWRWQQQSRDMAALCSPQFPGQHQRAPPARAGPGAGSAPGRGGAAALELQGAQEDHGPVPAQQHPPRELLLSWPSRLWGVHAFILYLVYLLMRVVSSVCSYLVSSEV